MSFEEAVYIELLEEEYERYRSLAERARGTDPERARTYYRECASLLDQIAERETSDRLATERRELAENLRSAANLLADRGSAGGHATGTAEGDVPAPADTTGTDEARRGNGAGDSDAASYLEPPPTLTFEDVGGMTDVKERLRDTVIDPLERPDLYEAYDLGVVNGVLLYGPPGTGKTYLSRALAGTLGYDFIHVTPAGITSSLVGEAADNVADLFAVARANQPCLVFVDELDALVPARSGGAQKIQSERQMVNQFLTELTESRGEDVVVIGATNLPDEIDGAAVSRFQERVEVPPPDAAAREAILRVHLRDRPLVTDRIDWERVRSETAGYSGRDLELVASNAAREALSEARETGELRPIEQSHVDTGIEATSPSLHH